MQIISLVIPQMGNSMHKLDTGNIDAQICVSVFTDATSNFGCFGFSITLLCTSTHIYIYIRLNALRVLFGDMISFIKPIIIPTNKFDAVIWARTTTISISSSHFHLCRKFKLIKYAICLIPLWLLCRNLFFLFSSEK